MIYIAASLQIRDEAEELADALRVRGVSVASTWHARPVGADPSEPEERLRIWETCTREIVSADYMIALLHVGEPRTTLVEVGYALALGVAVVMVRGDRGLPIADADCKVVDSVGAAVEVVLMAMEAGDG